MVMALRVLQPPALPDSFSMWAALATSGLETAPCPLSEITLADFCHGVGRISALWRGLGADIHPTHRGDARAEFLPDLAPAHADMLSVSLTVSDGPSYLDTVTGSSSVGPTTSVTKALGGH